MTTSTLAELHDLPLLPHPASGAGPVRSVQVSARLGADGLLAIAYELRAVLPQLRLASASERAQRRDELWRHTCFELFAQRGGQEGYLEFNFAPSGDWAAYQFDGYRRGQRAFAQRRIGVTTQLLAADRLQLRAQAELGTATDWQLRPAAVIEAGDGSLSYWAIEHRGAQPDFHDPRTPAASA